MASNKNSFALKEMGNDKGMLTHHAVKEILTLRKLDHPNIAGVQDIHWNHDLSDMSKFDEDKKDIKLYIQMEQAQHDLMQLTQGVSLNE